MLPIHLNIMASGRRTSIIDKITGGHRRKNSDEEAQDELKEDETNMDQYDLSPDFGPTLQNFGLAQEVLDGGPESVGSSSTPPANFGLSGDRNKTERPRGNRSENQITENSLFANEGFEKDRIAAGEREAVGPLRVPNQDIVFVPGRRRPKSSQRPSTINFRRVCCRQLKSVFRTGTNSNTGSEFR